MGEQLHTIFQDIREKKGLYARFQLSVQLRIPSVKALNLPDDPKTIAKARRIASEIIGETNY